MYKSNVSVTFKICMVAVTNLINAKCSGVVLMIKPTNTVYKNKSLRYKYTKSEQCQCLLIYRPTIGQSCAVDNHIET